jgi:hypothetical protein
MFSVSLLFLLLFSACLSSTFAHRSPFEIVWDYDDQAIIENNFTITCKFHLDVSSSVESSDAHPSHSYLVDLTLEVPVDRISMDFWCEPPAIPVPNDDINPSRHACQLIDVSADEQPTMTVALLAHTPGEITPMIRVHSSSLPVEFTELRGNKKIVITVRDRRWSNQDRHRCRAFRRIQE